MKVYRIKHKPSGLYCDYENNSLSTEGDVLPWKPDLSIGFFTWVGETPVDNVDNWEYLIIPEEDLEIKEYDLED